MSIHLNEKISIVGGTVFSIIPSIPSDDIIVTIIMGFVGASVSFMTSMLFKSIIKFIKKCK